MMSASNDPSSSLSSNLVDTCVQVMDGDEGTTGEKSKVVTTIEEKDNEPVICGYGCLSFGPHHRPRGDIRRNSYYSLTSVVTVSLLPDLGETAVTSSKCRLCYAKTTDHPSDSNPSRNDGFF